MKTKEIKEALKKQENGNWENGKTITKTEVQICAEQIDELLKKYKCKLICVKEDYYGQLVYRPIIAPDK